MSGERTVESEDWCVPAAGFSRARIGGVWSAEKSRWLREVKRVEV